MARSERRRSASVVTKVVEPRSRTGSAIEVTTRLPNASRLRSSSTGSPSATNLRAHDAASALALKAERELIGTLLLDHTAYARVAGTILLEDFADARHATIFAAIQDLATAGSTIESLAVCDRLNTLDQLETAGNVEYVADLVEDTPSVSNIGSYIRLVREHATRQRIREIGQRLAAGVHGERNLDELLAENATALTMLKVRSTNARLALSPLDEFIRRPTVSWLVRDLLPAGALAVFYGAPKSGKTHVVADILLHAAHAIHWHGHVVSKRLRVAYLIGEGQAGLRVRFRAWRREHPSDVRADFRVLSEALPLASRLGELLSVLQEFKPDVIAVDTLNAYFGDLDENSSADMTVFLSAVRRLRDELGSAVAIVHHTGHADARRERGSSVLRGAVDVAVLVARDASKGDGHIGVQVVAARDMDTWEAPLSLRLVPAKTDWFDEQGAPITTCLITRGDRPVSVRRRTRQSLSSNQEKVMEIVDVLSRQRADGADVALISRSEIVALAERVGASRAGAYRAIYELAKRLGWRQSKSGEIEVPVR